MSIDRSRMYVSEPNEVGGVVVDLQPGQRLLDRFTISRVLGRGSVGTVYLANDDVRSMEVALKIALVASDIAAEQVRHEIRLSTKITDHSHVVRLFDIHCAEYEGLVLLLISMEYADGGSLRQWLIENKDDPTKRRSEGVRLFVQASEGVQALHDAGIVHGDVKPENLLFVNGVLKVSDLSLSRHIHDSSSDHWVWRSGQVGHFVGTPTYMSPEQFDAAHPDDVDCRSDLYSLCIILCEMQHPRCRPPFGGSCEQLRDRHLHMAPLIPEGVEGNCARVIARCLQKDPRDRYQNVEQMLDDLQTQAERTALCPAPIDPQLQIDQRVDSLWRQAVECVEARRLEEARRLCSRILRIDAEHDNAQRMLEEIQCRDQQARQFYAKIERGIAYQSLGELLPLLEEAVSIYPNHPDGRLVQNQLLSLTGQYDEAMHQAVAAINANEWQLAQANLERARQIEPGSPAIVRLCEYVSEVRLQITTMRNGINAAIEEGQRDKAIFLAHNLDAYIRQIGRPENQPREWRTLHEYNNPLHSLYQFARRICADVLGGTR
jgi:serine/threonine protein kinase